MRGARISPPIQTEALTHLKRPYPAKARTRSVPLITRKPCKKACSFMMLSVPGICLMIFVLPGAGIPRWMTAPTRGSIFQVGFMMPEIMSNSGSPVPLPLPCSVGARWIKRMPGWRPVRRIPCSTSFDGKPITCSRPMSEMPMVKLWNSTARWVTAVPITDSGGRPN